MRAGASTPTPVRIEATAAHAFGALSVDALAPGRDRPPAHD